MKSISLKYGLLLGLLTCCGFTSASAQRQGIKNMPYIDQRRFHYGFTLGITMADVNFEHTGVVNDDGASWFAESPGSNASFCVGLLGDMAITEHVNLRCNPMLYFESRDVTFYNPKQEVTKSQTLKTSYFELPVSLKFSSHRINNYRPYIMGGVSAFYDMTHEQETPIVFNHFDMGLHVGIGCDTYLPFFKFVPELRFNFGLKDMIDHKRSGLKDESMMQYTNAISRARNRSVSLIFYFE